MSTQAEAYRRQQRGVTIGVAVIVALLLVVIVLLLGNWRSRERHEAQTDEQLTALSTSNDALREQVILLGGEPVAPPAGEVVKDPTIVEPPEPISPAKLEMAARTALAAVMPREVSGAVSRYVALCAASGDCKGPAGTPGPPGEPGASGSDGRPPTPGEVQTAVLTVCSAELDCEATPDEIAQAVAAYCGQAGDPCGRWTEAEILTLATRATIEYLSGRPVYCPPLRDFPRDEPFGPCYVTSG